MASLELAEQLIVEIIPIREHHERRILHCRMAHDPGGIEQHGKALAAPLRMPNDSSPTITGLPAMDTTKIVWQRLLMDFVGIGKPARSDGFFDRSIDRVELVVTRNDLVDGSAIGVLFEDDVVLQ